MNIAELKFFLEERREEGRSIMTEYLHAVGTASVKHSFSQMTLVRTKLRRRINDHNTGRLRPITIQ